ncbi:MAG: YggT family protein [Treponema sp.]|nr:YggT family protein [Treponema sp.]
MKLILMLVSAVISIYAVLCMIRIIITWIRSLSYSPFARFLAGVCDPYLNLFRGKRILCIAGLDFGPALGISILGAVAALISSIGRGGLHFGFILSMIISLAWSIAASIISFFILILVIRLIVFLIGKDNDQFWDMVDGPINQISGAIIRPFSGGKPVPFKTRLIASIIILVVADIVGSLVIASICHLVGLIPF